MRIVFWNILHGGGNRRTPEIALALLDWAADVIILCEFRTTLGGQLRGVLADHGWEHQLCTDPPEGSNGLMLASRTPLTRLPDVGSATPQRLIGVAIPDRGLQLLAAHVPPLEAQDGEAQAVWHALLAAARTHATDQTLVIGDLNAGRRWQDEAGLSGLRRLSKEPPALQRVGSEAMGRLWLMGYRDAWREGPKSPENAPNSAPAHEFTWFSHLGRGVRIDHVLASAPLFPSVSAVRYDHAVRRDKLSDHAAVIVEISGSACF